MRIHARYEVARLLYWESYDEVHRALAREKQLKGWAPRQKNRPVGTPQSAVERLSRRMVPVNADGGG